MAAVTETILDVLVVGGANMDYLAKGPRLPGPGSTVQGTDFQEAPGGKGGNQAVGAARLGARVALVARVGVDQRASAIVRRLADEHVDTQMIVSDPDAPTGVALIMVDNAGEKQILTAPGANWRMSVSDVTRASHLFARARVVLLQLEVPLDAVSVAVRLARAADARVVLDPAPATPVADELLRDVDVIRPNASEAEVLTGIEVHDVASARKAAGELVRRGAHAACVGAPGGNLVLWSEGELWLPHLPVKAVDATGAGDAFAGALAVALAEGQSIPDAARFGHVAAALKTSKLGAQAGLPGRAEVVAALNRFSGEHLFASA